jgi:uncharacterized protein
MWRNAVISRIEALEHPAWGAQHCRRLHATCHAIVSSERLTADEDVLFAIAWLHDIGTFAEFACDAQTPPECAAKGAEQLLAQA